MGNLYKRHAKRVVERIWKDPTDIIEYELNSAVESWRAKLLLAMAKAGHKEACDFVLSWNGDMEDEG